MRLSLTTLLSVSAALSATGALAMPFIQMPTTDPSAPPANPPIDGNVRVSSPRDNVVYPDPIIKGSGDLPPDNGVLHPLPIHPRDDADINVVYPQPIVKGSGDGEQFPPDNGAYPLPVVKDDNEYDDDTTVVSTRNADVVYPEPVPKDDPVVDTVYPLPVVKESAIEKRCSAWNKVFNPCSCPSQRWNRVCPGVNNGK